MESFSVRKVASSNKKHLGGRLADFLLETSLCDAETAELVRQLPRAYSDIVAASLEACVALNDRAWEICDVIAGTEVAIYDHLKTVSAWDAARKPLAAELAAACSQQLKLEGQAAQPVLTRAQAAAVCDAYRVYEAAMWDVVQRRSLRVLEYRSQKESKYATVRQIGDAAGTAAAVLGTAASVLSFSGLGVGIGLGLPSLTATTAAIKTVKTASGVLVDAWKRLEAGAAGPHRALSRVRRRSSGSTGSEGGRTPSSPGGGAGGAGAGAAEGAVATIRLMRRQRSSDGSQEEEAADSESTPGGLSGRKRGREEEDEDDDNDGDEDPEDAAEDDEEADGRTPKRRRTGSTTDTATTPSSPSSVSSAARQRGRSTTPRDRSSAPMRSRGDSGASAGSDDRRTPKASPSPGPSSSAAVTVAATPSTPKIAEDFTLSQAVVVGAKAVVNTAWSYGSSLLGRVLGGGSGGSSEDQPPADTAASVSEAASTVAVSSDVPAVPVVEAAAETVEEPLRHVLAVAARESHARAGQLGLLQE